MALRMSSSPSQATAHMATLDRQSTAQISTLDSQSTAHMPTLHTQSTHCSRSTAQIARASRASRDSGSLFGASLLWYRAELELQYHTLAQYRTFPTQM
eukprot:3940999-Rhodomonas_salina.2